MKSEKSYLEIFIFVTSVALACAAIFIFINACTYRMQNIVVDGGESAIISDGQPTSPPKEPAVEVPQFYD